MLHDAHVHTLHPSLSLYSLAPSLYYSIQLAVDVSIPEPLGGVGGEAVYIGTYMHIWLTVGTHIHTLFQCDGVINTKTL